MLIANLSKISITVVLFAMTLGVVYFGWTVSVDAETDPASGLKRRLTPANGIHDQSLRDRNP